MKLGLGTFALAWNIGIPGYTVSQPLDHFGFLHLAKRMGFRLVQYGDNLSLTSLDAEELSRLHELAKASGMEIQVGARGLTRERFQQSLAAARAVESPLLRFVIDGPHYEPALPEIIALIRSLTPLLEAHGILLALENHDRFTACEFASIITSVNHPLVAVCLDTANSLGAGDGLETVLAWLAPHTVNLHLKDFRIRRPEHQLGFLVEGTAAGEGMLSMRSLVERLAVLGRCGSAILELWPAPEATVEETAAKEIRWVASSLAHLRRLGCFSGLFPPEVSAP